MNPHTSLRLDALRACAALMVFCFHLSYLGYSGRALPTEVGRIGVLAFFVMSGYVIAYVTEHKHIDLRHYMNARCARLFSVTLPALLLTAVCDAFGRTLNPTLYAHYPDVYEMKAWLRLPFFVTFMFENSFLSLRWFSNGPMWSIAYEFWYYVIYGAAVYTRGRHRVVLLTTALLLAGWKILLLAPIWFAGALLYRHQRKIVTTLERQRMPLFWLSIVLVLCCWLLRTDIQPLSDWGGRQFGVGMHMYFLSDYLQTLPLLLLVGTLIVPISATRSSPVWRGLISTVAKSSFSVYLYHVPLILLFRASGIYNPQSLTQSAAAGGATLACCYLLATLTEHRKHAWLRFIEAVGARLVPQYLRIRPNV